MEIEKKYLVKQLPDDLENYKKKQIEQGYLCTAPVVRIRRSNEEYILTYKSKFGLEEKSKDTCISNEIEAPLDERGYLHLKEKIDGNLIQKTRYLIPLKDGLTGELDVFSGKLSGLVFIEVEFKSEEAANAFVPPDWFGEEKSSDIHYKNNYLCSIEDLSSVTEN